MLEQGRALMAKLDGKMEALDDLIRDAEVQIARLEALNRVAASVTRDERPSNVPPRPSIQLAQGIKGVKGNLRVDSPEDHVGPREAQRHEEIYALADAGLTSAAIAGRVGSPVGEIELILGLREKGW
jgi:hypothetical protein